MKTLILAVFTLFAASSALADQFLGQSQLYAGGYENVVVNTGGVCAFNAIRLQTFGDGVNFAGVNVTFDNGQTQFIRVRPYFAPGTGSEWKGLVGGNRCIRFVEVTAQALGSPGTAAAIQVYGGR